MTDFRALCAELLEKYDLEWRARERIKTALAQSEPEFTPEEVEMIQAPWSYLTPPQPEPQGPELIYRYSPVTIAECGGPCEQGPQYCDCGQITGEPKPQGPTDAASRVTHYLEQRRLIRGLEPEVIHALHSGTDETRQATLTASDLEALARWGRSTIKPMPVAERLPGSASERFEFSVFDSEYEEQAGGTAPTYSQALSEGLHYLAVYAQDGPHSLELRRVEVLPHHALPVPQQEAK